MAQNAPRHAPFLVIVSTVLNLNKAPRCFISGYFQVVESELALISLGQSVVYRQPPADSG